MSFSRLDNQPALFERAQCLIDGYVWVRRKDVNALGSQTFLNVFRRELRLEIGDDTLHGLDKISTGPSRAVFSDLGCNRIWRWSWAIAVLAGKFGQELDEVRITVQFFGKLAETLELLNTFVQRLKVDGHLFLPEVLGTTRLTHGHG